MNLLTLNGLESIAEKKFEVRADEWVWAIADMEGVGYDELRPHVISLLYISEWSCDITFQIPEHSAIRVRLTIYDEPAGNRNTIKLGNKKLIVTREWFAHRTNYVGCPSFHGCENLGHALLVSRWDHEGNEKAKWII